MPESPIRAEYPLNGSERLGLHKREFDSQAANNVIAGPGNAPVALSIGRVFTRRVGEKFYEITDHLGNVRVVTTDIKNGGNAIGEAPFVATVVSVNNYYPFGMLQPDRHWQSEDYRYGFNGMEKDDEVKDEGNSYTTHFRQMDPRLGKWLSIDPLAEKFPWNSPYVSMNNNPAFFVDPMGDEVSGGVTVDLSIGLGGERVFNYNLSVSAGLEISTPSTQSVLFGTASIYGGDVLGTSFLTDGAQFDLTASALFTLGRGSADRHEVYTLNYNTASPFGNSFEDSFTLGHILTYTSAANDERDKLGFNLGTQDQGIVGLRVGDFSLSSNNDTKNLPYLGSLFQDNTEDAGWTGGLVLTYKDIEFGIQTYTGIQYIPKEDKKINPPKYFTQTIYGHSLNKQSNFLRRGGNMVEVFSDGWGQHGIHDGLGVPRFKYLYRGSGVTKTYGWSSQ